MTRVAESSPSFATRLSLLLAGSVSTVVLGLAGCHESAPAQRVPPPPPVTVTRSRRMTLPIVVNPIGTTRALQDVTIRARVKGFLREKHFEEGGNVKAGQLLLVIEEEPFKIQLEQARAELAAAEAMLKKAIASKAAEVAKAQLALDQSQLLLDQVEERRERSLLARKAASQDEYDKADAQRKKSEAQVQADRAKYEEASADYQIEIDRAKADVEKARSAVEDSRINLSYCRMYAPINGRIGELKVKVGNLVGETGLTELVSIQQLDPMGVDLHPPARYLPVATSLLSQGLTVNLLVEGQRGHPHAGKANFIDNVVDPTTSTFLLRAEVPNPDGSVLPGQYIKANLIVGEYVDAVVVPEQAVVEGQEGSRVFVVDATNKVDVAKVKPVDVYQGLRVLESGLESGQKVIVEGIQLVRQGQVVQPIEAPIEQFIRTPSPITSVDQRFSSRVSRIPGMDPEAGQAGPAAKGAAPDGKASPAGRTPSAPAQPARPGERAAQAPEKKAR